MGGATQFEIELGTFKSVFRFPGATVNKSQVLDIFSYLLFTPTSKAEWSYHELAIGLKACQGAHVQTACVTDNSGQVVIEEGRPSEEPGTAESLTITLHHQRPLLRALWGWLTRLPLPEYRALTPALPFCPIPGKLKHKRWRLKSTIDGRCLETIDVEEPLMSTVLPQGWLAIGRRQDLGKKANSQLTLSIRGRPFHRRIKLGAGQIRALWRADHLPLDLSQSAPVEGRLLRDLLRELSQAVDSLRYEWLTSQETVSSTRVYRAIARQVARSLRTQGKLEEALAVISNVESTPSQRCNLHFQLDRLETAERIIREDIGQQDLPDHALALRYQELATIEGSLGRESAAGSWQKAYDLTYERLRGRRDHIIASCIESQLYWLPQVTQDWSAIYELWNQAREMKRKQLLDSHPRLAPNLELGAYLALLAPANHPTWSKATAMSLAEKAYAVRREDRGEGDPSIGQSLTVRALANHALQLPDAHRYAQQRLSLMTTVYGPEHPEVAASHHLLAAVGEQAEQNLERGEQILSSLGLPQDAGSLRVVCYRGWFHSRSPWRCQIPLRWEIGAQPANGPR